MRVVLIILASLAQAAFGIINGRNATYAPYQVSVQVNGTHKAGGVIIHPRFILTVAHIIASNETLSFVKIYSGSLNLSGNGTSYDPELFLPHQNYSRSFPYHYDIGLIKTTKQILFNTFTSEIPLIPITIAPGTELIFTGWGLSNLETGYRPDNLQEIDLTIVQESKCEEEYGIPVVGDREFCSISKKGSGPCHNDSGGPVTYQGRLYGIDSYGNSDYCDGEKPDITTSIPFHFNWIIEMINKNS